MASPSGVAAAESRGGIYSPGSPAAANDFQETCLRAAFGCFGITDIAFVRAEGVAMGGDHRSQAIGGAIAGIGGLLREAA